MKKRLKRSDPRVRQFLLLAVLLLFWFVPKSICLAQTEIKVGFLLSGLSEERYSKDQKYFLEEAKKLGFQVLLAACNNDGGIQIVEAKTLLQKGAQVLVVQPVNIEAGLAIAKLARTQKIKLIAYDRLISEADFYVTHDSFKVGVLQAEAAVKATHGKGNYVILKGQENHSVATEITKGIKSVLQKYPNIKIVAEKSHDHWSPSLAMATVEGALADQHGKIDAILANNSGMAQGAVRAVQSQGNGSKVFIAGADADVSSIRSIVLGKQSVDILKDIEALARAAATAAFAYVQGKTPVGNAETKVGDRIIPTLATPVYLVQKDNLEEKIFKPGFHDRKEVFGPPPAGSEKNTK